MKQVNSATGEIELQPNECVPPGPIVVGGIDWKEIDRRLAVLESQVASLQMAIPKAIELAKK